MIRRLVLCSALAALVIAGLPTAASALIAGGSPGRLMPGTTGQTVQAPASTAPGAGLLRGNCRVPVAADSDSSSGPVPKLLAQRVCIVPYELVRGDAEVMRCPACASYDKKLAEVPLSERFPSSYYQWDAVIDGGGLFRPGQAITGATQNGWNALANTIFGINRWVSGANAWLTQEAFTSNTVRGMTTGAAQSFKSLRDGLFARFAAILISFAGLWMMWQVLMGRVTRGAGGILLMMVCLIGSFYFAWRPVQTIKAASEFSEASSSLVLGVVGGADDQVSGRGQFFPKDTTKRQIARVNDRFWRMFVYNPWVVGEFGFKASGNTDALGKKLPAVDRRVRRDINRVLTTPPNLRQDDPNTLATKVGALDLSKLKRPDRTEGDEVYPGLEGNNVAGRVMSATMTLLCTVIFAFVQGWMAVMILLAGYVFIFLVIIGPFVLLVGLIPETGFNVVKNWAFACLGVLSTKAIFAAMLGIFATFFSMFQNSTHTSWGQGSMLLVATIISWVLFHQRQRLLSFTSGTAGMAFAGAMHMPASAHQAIRGAKDAKSAATPVTTAGGRISRGTMAPVLAGSGATLKASGARMSERGVAGEDTRANRMRMRMGRMLAGDASNPKSGGIGGRVAAKGDKFKKQAVHGKALGTKLHYKRGGFVAGAGAGALIASLRRKNMQGQRANAASERALAARRQADDAIRAAGFASPGQVRAARAAADMHDFTSGMPFDPVAAVAEYDLRREEVSALRKEAEDAIKATPYSTPGAAKAARDALDTHDWSQPFDPIGAVSRYDVAHEMGLRAQKKAAERVEIAGHDDMDDYKKAVARVKEADFTVPAHRAVQTAGPAPSSPPVIPPGQIEQAAMNSAAHRQQPAPAPARRVKPKNHKQLMAIRRNENRRRGRK